MMKFSCILHTASATPGLLFRFCGLPSKKEGPTVVPLAAKLLWRVILATLREAMLWREALQHAFFSIRRSMNAANSLCRSPLLLENLLTSEALIHEEIPSTLIQRIGNLHLRCHVLWGPYSRKIICYNRKL